MPMFYETPLGALPLYGIGPDKLESVTYLADGSEVNRGEAWNTVLYPDVAFLSFGRIRIYVSTAREKTQFKIV